MCIVCIGTILAVLVLRGLGLRGGTVWLHPVRELKQKQGLAVGFLGSEACVIRCWYVCLSIRLAELGMNRPPQGEAMLR